AAMIVFADTFFILHLLESPGGDGPTEFHTSFLSWRINGIPNALAARRRSDGHGVALRYRTASPSPKGEVSIREPPPRTSPPCFVPPVAGWNHAAAKAPGASAWSTVPRPAEGR